MSEPRILIIGGGIAGLAAGSYARMNGFAADVFESHHLPGGLCTGWDRKGFHFDGCLHWLMGSAPGSAFHRYLVELGALVDRDFHYPDSFMHHTGTDGQTVSWYCDADRLQAELLRVSSADRPRIRKLVRLIKAFAGFDMPTDKPFSLLNRREILGVILKMLPYGRAYSQAMAQTIGEFADSFQSSLIRESLRNALYDPRYPLMALATTLGSLHARSAGFPLGGSLALAKAIAARFEKLGGHLHLSSPVMAIRHAGGKAIGIQLADGRDIDGDFVIAACDLRQLLDKLLEGRFPSPAHETILAPDVPKMGSCLQVSFGLHSFTAIEQAIIAGNGEEAMSFRQELPQEFSFTGGRIRQFAFKDFGFDPSLAPAGHRVITCLIPVDDFAAWERLASDRGAYLAEKERIAGFCADQLENRFPGFRQALVTQDIASPLTYQRYTGSDQGRYMTYIQTRENGATLQAIPRQVPGLTGLWLAGMWVMAPGGVPSAIRTARDALQLICHQDGRTFKTV